jgi:hypothetical protein
MSNPQAGPHPEITLDELKQRLSRADEVVVDSEGKLHAPQDPSVANTPPQKKTVLKPQRWF